MTSPKDQAEDFVAALVAIIQACTGGLEDQIALQIEEQIRCDFAGERVYIHRAGWFNRDERDQAIRHERAAGASVRQLARRYTLSVSTVQSICDKA